MTLIFVGDLGATEDRDEGALWVADGFAEELQLLLDQEADRARLALEGLGGAEGAGVLAMGGAEGVVDVDVAELASWRAKLGSFFSSSLWKRRFSRRRTSPSLSAPAACSTSTPMESFDEFHRLGEQLGEAIGGGLEGELGFGAAFGPAEVRHQDEAAAAVDHVADRGQRLGDAAIVGDLRASSGTLKSTRISTRFSLHVNVGNGLLGHRFFS